ncbi:MAG TPA: ABC transporter ATP-binding protein [Thermoanaerobaculia bacterium]|nr:ABC transporter ATP-binding protein [Thermoanaerobaculia bacterium]
MAVHLDGVSLCYRLAKQRIPSLKEYAIHLVKGALVYDALWALQEIDLHVRAGESVGIVGRNGAGKSSLLKVISRVLAPTRGTVSVTGRVAPLLELGTGFDTELTGLENIYLNALLLGRRRREVQQQIDGIVAFSELEDFVRAPIRTYSSGMVARLAFAIATAWVPEVLILDEVLAVGDAAFQRKCLQRMAEFRRQGTTVLMVSHTSSSILEQCDRCIWLHQGRLMADGAPDDVVARYVTATGGQATVPAASGA